MAGSSPSSELDRRRALTPDDLQAHITAQGIAARLVRGLGDTSTVPLAAAALGVEERRIIKSLLFMVRLPEQPGPRQPFLVIIGGPQRVDYRAVAARFGISRKKVRLASAEQVLAILGYPAGGVPPFGHRTRVPVAVDKALLAGHEASETTVYAGGGDESTMLEITRAELLRVVEPEILSVSAA